MPPDDGSPDGGSPDAGQPDAGSPGTGGTIGFLRQYGGTGREHLRSAAGAPDGTFVVHGDAVRSTTFGGPVVEDGGRDVVVRYAAAGGHLWTLRMGTYVHVDDVAVADTGTVFVSGRYYGAPDLGGGTLPRPSSGAAAFLLALSPAGQHVWSRGFVGQPRAPNREPFGTVGVVTDPQGNPTLRGAFNGRLDFGTGPLEERRPNPQARATYLAHFDAGGRTLWARGLPGGLFASLLTADAQGNVLLGGSALANVDLGEGPWGNAEGEPFVVSFSAADGRTRWRQALRGARGSVESGTRAPGGRLVFAASVQHAGLDFAAQRFAPTRGSDLLLFALGADGAPAWAHQYGGEDGEGGFRLVADAQGRLTLSMRGLGRMNFGGADIDVPAGNERPGVAYFARYDAEGRHVWSRYVETPTGFDSFLHDIVAQPDGSAVVVTVLGSAWTEAGRTLRPNGEDDALLIQLRP